MYVVQPAEALWFGREWSEVGKQLPEDYRYASNTNEHWLNYEEIKEIVRPFETENGLEG